MDRREDDEGGNGSIEDLGVERVDDRMELKMKKWKRVVLTLEDIGVGLHTSSKPITHKFLYFHSLNSKKRSVSLSLTEISRETEWDFSLVPICSIGSRKEGIRTMLIGMHLIPHKE